MSPFPSLLDSGNSEHRDVESNDHIGTTLTPRKGGGGGGGGGRGGSRGGSGGSSGSSSRPGAFGVSGSPNGRTASPKSNGGGKSFTLSSGPYAGRAVGGGTRVCALTTISLGASLLKGSCTLGSNLWRLSLRERIPWHHWISQCVWRTFPLWFLSHLYSKSLPQRHRRGEPHISNFIRCHRQFYNSTHQALMALTALEV
jgi:hypothetical protein